VGRREWKKGGEKETRLDGGRKRGGQTRREEERVLEEWREKEGGVRR